MSDIGAGNLKAQAIGQIAIERPGATAIFRKHKLDFCCGGSSPLADAAAKRGADAAAIERELLLLDAEMCSVPEATGELIDYILERFHESHRRELPELILLARRVERVHADNPTVPVGLANFLARLAEELGGHMIKEERILFPMMRSGGHSGIGMPIACMRSEHLAHAEEISRLAALTKNHTPPDGACNSWRALYAGTRKLEVDLMEHIHLENNILFARFCA